jgi:hypothetical protein
MEEELPQYLPPPDNAELVFGCIECDLETAGIKILNSNIDGTITTDKEVPEDIKENIVRLAGGYGFNIKFLT